MLIGGAAAPPPAAQPVVEDADTKKGRQGSSSNSWSLTYPTNPAADDVFAALLAQSNQFAAATWPGSWSQLRQLAGSGQRFHVAWMRATGSESGTFNVGFNTTVAGNWMIYRISGSDPLENVEIAGDNTGTGTTAGPNPGTISPSWGAQPTLFLPIFSSSPNNYGISSVPTGYSDGETQGVGQGTNPIVGAARKHDSVASENPGAFTMLNGGNNISWTTLLLALKAA